MTKTILHLVENKNPKNKTLKTPLHLAALRGDYEIAKMILDMVFDNNPEDIDGNTPLHYATMQG